MKKILVMAFVLLCAAVQMQGKIKLPAIISDNMVVQQKSQVKLWGWADAGEQVQVKTSWGKEAETVADAEGKWSLHLKTPLSAHHTCAHNVQESTALLHYLSRLFTRRLVIASFINNKLEPTLLNLNTKYLV
jgi:hypothetical protein